MSTTANPTESCVHCGEPCEDERTDAGTLSFCCQGCKAVYDILHDAGLTSFYTMDSAAGVRPERDATPEGFAYLDRDETRDQILDFSDGHQARVTLHVPQMHCVACIWLLENLFRLNDAVLQSRVNFPRKQVALRFQIDRLPLSGLVALLARLGYSPELNLASSGETARAPRNRALTIKLAVAGFAFANTMLLSLPAYFGMDPAQNPGLHHAFTIVALLLSLPVLLYCASDYLRGAWRSIRLRIPTIELPIGIGIVALYTESLYQFAIGSGAGYLDSFTGLVFFLLCGRWFRQRTYDALSFERDYRSYFPLCANRCGAGGDEAVPITDLQVGDRIRVRNGELIPADATLASGEARIDFSFVTGESDPVHVPFGEQIYAGGRQAGGAIELTVTKPVDDSYLVSLWNDDAFRKDYGHSFRSITNRFSGTFTAAVIAIAAAAGLFWFIRDATLAPRAFVSVLIVACPCALALAAPFATGTALRLLARRGIFLRNADLVEALAKVDHIVFDKTGTLTRAGASSCSYDGEALNADLRRGVGALAGQSTHPASRAVADALGSGEAELRAFIDEAGRGIAARVNGIDLRLGSANWLSDGGAQVPPRESGTVTHLSAAGRYLGTFTIAADYRPRMQTLVRQLGQRHALSVLSGDNESEAARLRDWFGDAAALHFRQSPHDKLAHIRALQENGKRVMMIGDGLNDAGALKQSDIGVAITENAASFAPASDVILDASQISHLDLALGFTRQISIVIVMCLVLSLFYNAIGVTFAAAGQLSPLVSAILMPLSSVTVVALAAGSAVWAERKAFRTQ